MPQHSSKFAVPLGLIGIPVLTACVTDWLCDPLVAELLWPADVNNRIVELLGGQAGRRGKPAELSFLTILSVLSVLTVVIPLIGRLIHRDRSFSTLWALLLGRLGMVGLAGGTVWLLPQLVTDAYALQMLPSLLMLVAGATLYCYLVTWLPQSSTLTTSASSTSAATSGTSGGSLSAWVVLLAATIAWTAVSFQLNERLYANLLIPHGDSAMYEEHLWNVWHGKGFRSYLDQGLFLGEHIQVIHLLLLPVHLLLPSHLTLEMAESVALGSCTIPLFLIVRRRTGDAWAACLLAVSWLLFFPVHFLDIAIDQKTFRPICLGLPFLFWMINSAESGRFRLAWLCLLLALSAKEDVALITAPMAAVMAIAAWRNGPSSRALRNWGLAAAVFSAAWLLLSVLVVIPAFRSGDVVHYSRYFGDLGSSPGELIRTALTRPGLVLARIFSSRTLLYVIVFLTPLAFLPLRSPLRLSAGVFTFAMLSLLELGNGPDGGGLPPVPYHHFHAPLLPVLFWAAASGLAQFHSGSGATSRRELPPGSSRSAALLALCCCLTTGLSGSLFPLGAGYWSETSGFGRSALYYPSEDSPNGRHLRERAAMAERVVEQIPPDSRVASTDFIHTRLTHCERSYDYSDYERVINEPGKRVPADTEYIVIDTGHRYSSIRSADEVPELQEPGEWELLPDTTNGHFLILRRRTSDASIAD